MNFKRSILMCLSAIISTAFGVLITGCQNKVNAPDELYHQNLPTKIEGSSDRLVNEMQNTFHKQRIKVISIGQENLISIPSALLFPDNSPQLSWGAYSVLNEITKYLKQMRTIDVYVTAYAGHYRSTQRDLALTSARAINVSNYLWSQGIDSRMIFARGMATQKPVIAFFNEGDKAPNSRIEIKFREAIT